MYQEKQGLRLTKELIDPPNDDTSNDLYQLEPTHNYITHAAVYSIIAVKNKEYMDLTGRFPYFSSRGNEYVLIAYHYDANIIVRVLQKNYKQILL